MGKNGQAQKNEIGKEKKYSLYGNPRIKATISFRCSPIFFFPRWTVFEYFRKSD